MERLQQNIEPEEELEITNYFSNNGAAFDETEYCDANNIAYSFEFKETNLQIPGSDMKFFQMVVRRI